MTLKSKISYPAFIDCVRRCKNEVFFQTDAGDQLNLKSTLSTYIFVTIAADPEIFCNGKIICKDTADYEILKEYLNP